MLDIKEAISKGKSYVSDLFQTEGASDFLLEEVDFSSKEQSWYITISFLRKEKAAQKRLPKHEKAIASAMAQLYDLNERGERRIFKTAVIDSSSGDLVKIVRDSADIAA